MKPNYLKIENDKFNKYISLLKKAQTYLREVLTSDELQKEKDLVKDLTVKLKDTDKEASDLIQKKIDDWPDVVDS